ncbi:MAG: HEAT repeat domain-containing protein [Fibrobacteria bacterium]
MKIEICKSNKENAARSRDQNAIGFSSNSHFAIFNLHFSTWFSILSLISIAASAPAFPAFRFVRPVFTHQDSLFIVAATGEPRFKGERDSAERELISGDTATLDYLVRSRLEFQTPRQRHYIETLFKAISDSGRNHGPVERIAAALPKASDSVKAQLLHIGSELGDSAFLSVARLYLTADSTEVRKAAVRSLGSYPSPANVSVLLDGLEKTRDLELQKRLWALSMQADIKEWPRLLPLMRDSNLYNRQLVRQIVGKACSGNWQLLERYIPQPLDQTSLMEWIQLALETPGIDAKAYVRKNASKLDGYERRFIQSMY